MTFTPVLRRRTVGLTLRACLASLAVVSCSARDVVVGPTDRADLSQPEDGINQGGADGAGDGTADTQGPVDQLLVDLALPDSSCAIDVVPPDVTIPAPTLPDGGGPGGALLATWKAPLPVGGGYYGIVRRGSTLILSEFSSNTVHKLGLPSGIALAGWPRNTGSKTGGSHGLGVDPCTGKIWLADLNNDQVIVFNEELVELAVIYMPVLTGEPLVWPVNVLIHGNHAYVAGRKTLKIHKIDRATLALVKSWSIPYTPGALPDIIAMHAYGEKIYLVSDVMNTIVVSDLEGNNMSTIAVGSQPLLRGTGIYLEHPEAIFVTADRGRRVLKITSKGDLLNSWYLPLVDSGTRYVGVVPFAGKVYLAENYVSPTSTSQVLVYQEL
jgi:DNA-binding beta-propeller fold protein YncE